MQIIYTEGEDNCARGCEGHAFSQSVVVEGCVDRDVGPLFYQGNPWYRYQPKLQCH